MIPFDAMEMIGRERRETLLAEAENRRRARAGRGRRFATRMPAPRLSSRRPSLHVRHRPAAWGWRIVRLARRTT